MQLLAKVVPGVFAATIVLAAGPAGADVIDPSTEACLNKKAGDACSAAGKSGACRADTCSRNDYSDGVPPKLVDYECLICDPEAKVEAAADSGAAGSGSPEASSPKKSGCAVGATSVTSFGVGLLLLGLVARRRRR